MQPMTNAKTAFIIMCNLNSFRRLGSGCETRATSGADLLKRDAVLCCYSPKTGFFEAVKLPFAALRSVPSGIAAEAITCSP
jgi:hypothetical protein